MAEDQYLPAAKLGVTKVNIDTDGRLVWCAVYRETFRDKPADFDPRTPGKPFMAAYAEYITHKNKKLGSAGQLESGPRGAGRPAGLTATARDARSLATGSVLSRGRPKTSDRDGLGPGESRTAFASACLRRFA